MAAKTIEDYSKDYYAAKAAGDAAGMKAANDAANAIRASTGQAAQYANEDISNVAAQYAKSAGTAYPSSGQNIQNAVQAGRDAAMMEYQPKNVASSQADYIRELYEAQQRAALKQLESAYKQNVISLDATAAKIPGIYDTARNQAASASAINKANFNEAAAASGLNSGAGSQAALSQNNALLGNLSTLSGNQAQAQKDLETERLRLQTGYKSDIAQAIANGELAQAQALYNEAIRVDESLVSGWYQQANLDLQRQSQQFGQDKTSQSMLMQQAETLAAYGDFSGYKALGYSDANIAQMEAVWKASNPKIMAAMSGGSGSGGYGSSGAGGSSYSQAPVSTSAGGYGGSGTQGPSSVSFSPTLIQARNMVQSGTVPVAQIAAFLQSRIASGVIKEYESDLILNMIGL